MISRDHKRLFRLIRSGDAVGVGTLLNSGVTPDAIDDEGRTPLECAVCEGRLDMVRTLLAFGATPEPVLWSAFWSCTDEVPVLAAPVLAALLAAGADVNWQDNDNGQSALYQCAKHPELIRVLLEKGADPNRATANGETPLSFCCDWGHLESVQVLLGGESDPNHIMPDLQWSMLFLAAQGGHVEVLTALLDAGADPNWINERGQTALSVAIDHRKIVFAGLLLDRAPELASLGTADLVTESRGIPDEPLARRIESLRRQ